jgi:hypothetical protein
MCAFMACYGGSFTLFLFIKYKIQRANIRKFSLFCGLLKEDFNIVQYAASDGRIAD